MDDTISKLIIRRNKDQLGELLWLNNELLVQVEFQAARIKELEAKLAEQPASEQGANI